MALALAVLPALAACDHLGSSPVSGEGGAEASSSRQVATVGRGDSISMVAKRYAVSRRELIDLNHLKPPYRLEPGQELLLPSTRTYTVVPGDSLSALAHAFHTDTAELARINQLPPPYVIRVGQVLVLPGAADAASSTALATPGHKPEQGEAPLPAHGAAGAIQVAALPPPRPVPSQPAVAPAVAVAPVAPPMARHGNTAAPAAAHPPAALPVAASVPAPPAAAAPAADAVAKATPPTAVPPGRNGGRFLWPVQGKMLSGFGDKSDGRQNDGINIAAPPGTAVMAADTGVVAYAGNELRSYGNLLLIRHPNGYMTAYAHLDHILVERGAAITRGQKIGTVGATGAVTTPQLHFEVRRGSKVVNPGDLMETSHDNT